MKFENAMQLAKGGEAFWLNSRTVAHVFEEDDALALHVLDINFEAQSEGNPGVLSIPQPPVLIGKFPTKSATNFRYSASSGFLVFSAYVYSDGNLTAVKDHDKAWDSRGNSAFVYDATYERHWDTWVGSKKNSLFSVRVVQDPDRKWVFGEQFTNLLEGTDHVSIFRLHSSDLSPEFHCRVPRSNHLAEPTILMCRVRMSYTQRRTPSYLQLGTRNRMSASISS